MKPGGGLFTVLLYWLLANRAEALFGLDGLSEAAKALEVTTSFAPADWMIATTQMQFAKLNMKISVQTGPAPLCP